MSSELETRVKKKKYSRLQPKEKDRIIKLFEDGNSLSEISRIMDTCEETISRTVKYFKENGRHKLLNQWKKTTFSEDQKQDILDRVNKGDSCKNISKIYGVCVSTIRNFVNSTGLNFRKTAKVGDVVKNWKLIEIYKVNSGKSHPIKMGKLRSEIDDQIKTCSLSLITNGKILPPLKNRSANQHNGSGTKLYSLWKSCHTRCTNPNHRKYSDYGGRGIKVCDEWLRFDIFKKWCDENGYKQGLSLDRIDNDLGYSPDNCRWTTNRKQVQNRRCCDHNKYAAFGEQKTVYEWAEDSRCKCTVKALQHRFHVKWDIEKAIVTPSKIMKSKSPKKLYYQQMTEYFTMLNK